jgi:STE24 endopeptidase
LKSNKEVYNSLIIVVNFILVKVPMFTFGFVIVLLISVLLRLWLGFRQIRYIAQHRGAVPLPFSEKIPLDAHQRAADYTITNTRLALTQRLVEAGLLISFTLLGGLQNLNQFLLSLCGLGIVQELALIFTVIFISSIVELPFSLYKQFVIEKKFGFGRLTLGLFFSDLLKSSIIGLILGVPIIGAVLWLMESAGTYWWLWAWSVWMGFNILLLIFYPTVIAPRFNKFEPLPNGELRERIESLLIRCGFSSDGLFVMDGSRRSAHGNAYFTGFGKAKRIVFFDTLINRLNGLEIEAVLAHELGHFKHHHVTQRLWINAIISLVLFGLLGWLTGRIEFYLSLGVEPPLFGYAGGLALTLFVLVLPIFSIFTQPIAAFHSRQHEFQADAYAAQETDAHALITALVKLYEDNASTLTPDPLFSAFYYSHPPASQRIAHLNQLT